MTTDTAHAEAVGRVERFNDNITTLYDESTAIDTLLQDATDAHDMAQERRNIRDFIKTRLRKALPKMSSRKTESLNEITVRDGSVWQKNRSHKASLRGMFRDMTALRKSGAFPADRIRKMQNAMSTAKEDSRRMMKDIRVEREVEPEMPGRYVEIQYRLADSEIRFKEKGSYFSHTSASITLAPDEADEYTVQEKKLLLLHLPTIQDLVEEAHTTVENRLTQWKNAKETVWGATNKYFTAELL